MIYYVAVSIVHVDRNLSPGEAVEYAHGAAAIRRAETLWPLRLQKPGAEGGRPLQRPVPHSLVRRSATCQARVYS
jgi:hypothetical protein